MMIHNIHSRVRPAIAVATLALMACLPASHPLAGAASVGLEELAGQDLVVVSRTVSPDYHERILVLCEQAGWMPQVVHELMGAIGSEGVGEVRRSHVPRAKTP